MIGSVTVTEVDTVVITRAQYTTSRSQLTVQATDTNDTATLTVSVTSTGEVLGTDDEPRAGAATKLNSQESAIRGK